MKILVQKVTTWNSFLLLHWSMYNLKWSLTKETQIKLLWTKNTGFIILFIIRQTSLTIDFSQRS